MSDQTLFYFMLGCLGIQAICLVVTIVFMSLSAWNMSKVEQIEKETRRIRDHHFSQAPKQATTSQFCREPK